MPLNMGNNNLVCADEAIFDFFFIKNGNFFLLRIGEIFFSDFKPREMNPLPG